MEGIATLTVSPIAADLFPTMADCPRADNGDIILVQGPAHLDCNNDEGLWNLLIENEHPALGYLRFGPQPTPLIGPNDESTPTDDVYTYADAMTQPPFSITYNYFTPSVVPGNIADHIIQPAPSVEFIDHESELTAVRLINDWVEKAKWG